MNGSLIRSLMRLKSMLRGAVVGTYQREKNLRDKLSKNRKHSISVLSKSGLRNNNSLKRRNDY